MGSEFDLVKQLYSEVQDLKARVAELESKKRKPRKKAPTDDKTETKTPAVKEPTPTWKLFVEYCDEYERRYGVRPPRSSLAMGQCKNLIARVGFADAMDLVCFYVRQNDSYYVQKLHPFSLCLKNAESLFSRMKTGIKFTQQASRKVELVDSNLRVSARFVENKLAHGSS